MPWAWGLAWRILAPGPERRPFAPLLLSLVLVLQVATRAFPVGLCQPGGHFRDDWLGPDRGLRAEASPGQPQQPFRCAPGLNPAGPGLGDAPLTRPSACPACPEQSRGEQSRGGTLSPTAGPGSGDAPLTRPSGTLSPGGEGGVMWCALVCALAVVAVFPLTAAQLWPTARLASLAAGQRDFEYLSGFASTPFHLVNYVAPLLFHQSRLWRPLVWDPFHTSPEEHLAYVGLVPLCLACMTVLREWRRESSVRLLTVLAVVTLILSLGPYAPGFRYLIELRGFSFFRAPSRWSVATGLALALLAGKGFDRWVVWPQAGRAARRFAVVALLWVAAIVGVLELALDCTAAAQARPRSPEVSSERFVRCRGPTIWAFVR